MSDTIIKFLHSIKIDNVNDFDIDFLSIKKDQFGTWNYILTKDSPWCYDLLEYFCHSLDNINYKYSMKFSYLNKINSNDILNLFCEYYYSQFYKDIKEHVSIHASIITFDETFEQQEITLLKHDFYSLLDFISYPKVEMKSNNDETTSIYNDCEQEDTLEEINSDFSTNDIPFENADEEFDSDEIEKTIDNDINAQIHAASISIKNEADKAKVLYEGLINPERYRICELDDIHGPNAYILSSGKVFQICEKPNDSRGGNKRFKIGIHSGSSSFFMNFVTGKNISLELALKVNKIGTNVTFTGQVVVDRFLHNELTIRVFSIKIDPEDAIRDDDSKEQRVELHLHTKMSALDAVSTITDYAKTAAHWGMKAIAVTDHGCVQAFPEAQKAAKKYGLKMLYGSELYVVDDYFEAVFNPKPIPLNSKTYVVFDLETTGLSKRYDKIIEFGAVKLKDDIVVDSINILINPGKDVVRSKINIQINKITDEMLERKPTIDQVIDKILAFIGDSVLVSHNLPFDYGFLNEACKACGKPELSCIGVDTLDLSKYFYPEAAKHNLGALCRRYDVSYDGEAAHRAIYDAEVLANSWVCMKAKIFESFKDPTFETICHLKKEQIHIKHSREYHVTVLCKNKKGLKDLYKLISASNIDYLGRVPCVPRELLYSYRENLLIGSACFNGKVFTEASTGTKESLEKAISTYDYIELQPLGNYSPLVYNNQILKDTIIQYQKDIIDAAQKENKLIVATSDCHYLNKEDKIFRDIYICAPGLGKAKHPLQKDRDILNPYPNPDQYFMSTTEMLEEFSKFGKENAYNWVITNTNKIADMCEEIIPIPEGKLFTPTIKDADKILVKICYDNAHKLYGDPLPTLIEDRLKKELDGIVGHGYYVTYYIAHLIIKKAHEDGYIVGSRGSVGSSFAATMADITEVNPLSPHYRCPKCKHFELYEGDKYFSGYDLPEKKCPVCGEKMIGDGQNIPFETFLGFNAEKVPDIDLNFPPDYQAKAHEYTKVVFSPDHVFRAGTISTVASKTAFGYAKGYFERSNILNNKTTADISYLAAGCSDVKRTTGQHPGGIVVIPNEYDVYDFTPIQYPADDLDASWKTTHFDFHAIHDTVLKLDLLGHVDPQILKMLCDLTRINIYDIPLDDKRVISLFTSQKELNLKHNYLNVTNGAIALPEFGTDFVRGMLDETHPTTFSDLLIISGLSHGTDVWLNTQETLIKNHTTDLRGLIGCRDDIMTHLISMGVENSMAFKIMEGVRKGKGLSPEQEQILRDHKLPEYYISSCKKIKYLFPKAHATAYVTMAIRVAYFKLYYPLEFYASFFSVRVDKYDYEAMVSGADALKAKLDYYEDMKKNNKALYTKTIDDTVKTLVVALELYDRGMSIANISLEKSQPKEFLVDHEHNCLIPPFSVIDGLGDTVALSIVSEREKRKFSSIEDLVTRGKVNNTQIEIFKKFHIVDDLAEADSTQLNLFDF